MNPPTGIARTLATLLNAGGKVPVQDAILLVRALASQVAELHSRGQVHRGITPASVALEGDSTPALSDIAARPAESPADVRQYLPPELGQLLPGELPVEMVDAQRQLLEVGIALDPRQIDIYSLGALLCRLITGESAAAYLRSPRVKRDMPVALRPVVERALGSDGRTRFADATEFANALDCDPNVQSADDLDDEAQARRAEDESTPSIHTGSIHTGDTTPSCVNSGDTSTWVTPADSREASSAEIPFHRLGHYEVVGRIGHGGMGDVYQGYELGLDRQVAIKVLPPDLARQSDFVRRFKAEATAAAKLIHPNIIQIYFIGEDAGHHFFAMQYVAGESLAELLSRRGRLSVDETTAIIEQALSGLAAAHKQGLVHRDIKPANILLDREHRRALLADFGLVKTVAATGTGHTATGVVMGTVDYISPEQGRGQAVDSRSDLYSLGVLLYQMLSGRLPFHADSPTALIFQHVYEQPPPLSGIVPDVPPLLAAIIAKLMRKLPADRYQTVEAVLTDLRAFRSGQPLPSGADRLPAQDSAARSTRSSMVFAPVGMKSDEPALPPEIRNLKPPNWWERTGGRAKSLFWRHAPEAIQRLQNTQQQIDGAVARYARQERELRRLSEQAESVLSDLQAQIREHRSAAEEASQQAARASDTAAIHAAQSAEIVAKQSAMELERQATEQHDQLGAIKLKLAQIVSKRRELENRRDILNARLKLAGVRVAITGGRIPRSRGKSLIVAGAAMVVLVGIVVVWSINTLPKHLTDVDGVTKSQRKTSLDAGAPSSPTVQSAVPIRDLKEQAPLELRALPLTRIPPYDKTKKQHGVVYHPNSLALWVLTDSHIFSFPNGTLEGAEFQPLQAKTPKVSMALSADGELLAGGSGSSEEGEGGRVSIMRSDSGRLQKSSPKLFQSVQTVVFSPDDKTVAAIHVDEANRGHLRLWPTGSMDKPRTVANDQINIQCVVFDPRGKWLAGGSVDGIVHLYDPATGVKQHELKGHPGAITALAAGPDGCTLVSGDAHGKLFLWDATSGQKLGEFEAHGKQIEAVAISPDGVHLASSDSGSTVIWDMSIGAVRLVFDTTGPTQLAFNRTGKTLATLEMDSGRVATWNPIVTVASHTGRIQGSTQLSKTQSISTPPLFIDRTHFVYAAGSTAYLYDTLLKDNLPRFAGHTSPIRSLAMSEDHTTLVSGAEDGSIRFWNTASGETTATLAIPSGDEGPSPSVQHLVVSENGRLAVAATAEELFVLEPEGATKIRPLDCPLDQLTALAWYPSAEPLVLIGGRDPETSRAGVVVWNVSRSVAQTQVRLSNAPVVWLSADTVGSRFVCAAGGIIRICSIGDGSIIRRWTIPDGENAVFAMSPDRRKLGVGIATDKLRVGITTHIGMWNLNTGQEFLRLSRDVPAAIRSMSFAPDDAIAGIDENSAYFSRPMDQGHFLASGFKSLFNDVLNELHGPWATTAMSHAGRTSMLQGFELDQNPLIQFKGPNGDADLANFSTDGGWWINQGTLIRQPSSKRLAVDLGIATNFELDMAMIAPQGSRVFFLLGWDRFGGYCLSPQSVNGKYEWSLSSLSDGHSQRIPIPNESILDRFDETRFKLRVSANKLVLSAGTVDVKETSIALPDYRTGRLVMGVINGTSNSKPVKILRAMVNKF